MVLWNLKCPVGLSQREICAHFNEGNLAQFRRSAEIFIIWFSSSTFSSILYQSQPLVFFCPRPIRTPCL